MTEVVARLGVRWDECAFWATHQGAELDLLIVRGRRRIGVEFKRSSAPRFTTSMRIAQSDLRLSKLYVVHPGDESYPLAKNARAVNLGRLSSEIAPMR